MIPVPEGPGAYDDMAGAAIIMELCRYFQQYRPRRTMEFVWFGAEEKELAGQPGLLSEFMKVSLERIVLI